jgi:peroxiredoxin Q/BCP
MGVSFDTPEANKAFAEKYGFPYRLLCDVDRKVGVAYGAADDAAAKTARRISVLIDPQGKVHKVWPKVDTKAHPGEVLALLP